MRLYLTGHIRVITSKQAEVIESPVRESGDSPIYNPHIGLRGTPVTHGRRDRGANALLAPSKRRGWAYSTAVRLNSARDVNGDYKK